MWVIFFLQFAKLSGTLSTSPAKGEINSSEVKIFDKEDLQQMLTSERRKFILESIRGGLEDGRLSVAAVDGIH
jgi:hypothetical protein